MYVLYLVMSSHIQNWAYISATGNDNYNVNTDNAYYMPDT